MTTPPRARALMALALTFGLFMTPAAGQEGESSLVGVYSARGVGPDGAEYQSYVVIASHGESLLVVWRPVQGGTLAPEPDAAGVAIVNGGVLAVSFYGKGGSGLVVYTIEADGTLTGRWTVVGGDGTTYPEVLTKITGHPAPPPADDDAPDEPSPEPRPVKVLRAA